MGTCDQDILCEKNVYFQQVGEKAPWKKQDSDDNYRNQ